MSRVVSKAMLRACFLAALVAMVAVTAASAARRLETEDATSGMVELMERADTQRRRLQQEGIGDLPAALTAPVGWASGIICNAVPRSMYQDYLGAPWWAPTGILQGICANTVTGGVLGMSI
mmetsp:Transcript_7663/g.19654  ORF Transcript_7663/g.19654 Transcript_7663/m.19654 type:complete len:121 (-) Transcript_7663:42-404(-)